MTEIIQIIENEVTIVTESSPNVIEVNRGGPQGVAGPAGTPGAPGATGPAVADGDKGDIVVSASGATWTIDPALLSVFMRGITASSNEGAFKAAVNLEIGVDVQAYSATLAATTASYTTTKDTKLGHISITQAVDLDAIETKINGLVVADITNMSANGRSLVTAANYAAMQTLLGNDAKAPLASPTFTGVVTTAGQIAFPAVANPSVGANVLDDYEEGTFTPAVSGTSAAGAGTYSVQTGNYTKIGNVCHVEIELTWSAHTGTGNLSITGLPFTSKNIFSALTIIPSNLTFASAPLVAGVVQSGTAIYLYSAATNAALGSVAMDTAATLYISGSYLTV